MDDPEVKRVSWRRLEFAGVSALTLTLCCVVVGQVAEHYAANFVAPPTQVATARPRFNAIDYAVTGATKSATVIIGPCDTRHP